MYISYIYGLRAADSSLVYMRCILGQLDLTWTKRALENYKYFRGYKIFVLHTNNEFQVIGHLTSQHLHSTQISAGFWQHYFWEIKIKKPFSLNSYYVYYSEIFDIVGRYNCNRPSVTSQKGMSYEIDHNLILETHFSILRSILRLKWVVLTDSPRYHIFLITLFTYSWLPQF